MIEATTGGTDRFGAGIIFGAERDALYVVTANHVVREGAIEADGIHLRLRWQPGQLVKAALLPQFDAKLDIAVLRVSGLDATKIRLDAMPFEEVRDPATLQRGEGIYLLGYLLRRAWRMNTTPERFTDQKGDTLEFESNFLSRGHSGGVLLTGRREIVGMLKSEDPPYGEAASIVTVMGGLRGGQESGH